MGDLISFGISILSGLLIGIIFDVYRGFRYYSNPKKVLSTIEDFLFWVLIGILFFLLLVQITDGVLRGFVFIGAFSGGLVYMLIISKFIYPIIILIYKLILEMISEIIRLLTYPFRKISSFSKKRLKKVVLVPKILFKEMGRYKKIISKKK